MKGKIGQKVQLALVVEYL